MFQVEDKYKSLEPLGNTAVFDLTNQRNGMIPVWVNSGHRSHQIIVMRGLDFVDTWSVNFYNRDQPECITVIHKEFQLYLYLEGSEISKSFLEKYPNIKPMRLHNGFVRNFSLLDKKTKIQIFISELDILHDRRHGPHVIRLYLNFVL